MEKKSIESVQSGETATEKQGKGKLSAQVLRVRTKIKAGGGICGKCVDSTSHTTVKC